MSVEGPRLDPTSAASTPEGLELAKLRQEKDHKLEGHTATSSTEQKTTAERPQTAAERPPTSIAKEHQINVIDIDVSKITKERTVYGRINDDRSEEGEIYDRMARFVRWAAHGLMRSKTKAEEKLKKLDKGGTVEANLKIIDEARKGDLTERAWRYEILAGKEYLRAGQYELAMACFNNRGIPEAARRTPEYNQLRTLACLGRNQKNDLLDAYGAAQQSNSPELKARVLDGLKAKHASLPARVTEQDLNELWVLVTDPSVTPADKKLYTEQLLAAYQEIGLGDLLDSRTHAKRLGALATKAQNFDLLAMVFKHTATKWSNQPGYDTRIRTNRYPREAINPLWTEMRNLARDGRLTGDQLYQLADFTPSVGLRSDYFDEAFKKYEEEASSSDDRIRANATGKLAWMCRERDDLTRADELFKLAVPLYEQEAKSEHPAVRTKALMQLGSISEALDDDVKAIEYYEKVAKEGDYTAQRKLYDVCMRVADSTRDVRKRAEYRVKAEQLGRSPPPRHIPWNLW